MQKTFLNWQDIDERADKVAAAIASITKKPSKEPIRLFGIPRGGCFAVLAVARALERRQRPALIMTTVATTEYIIDDIIDSGKTRDKWMNGQSRNVFALVDKQGYDKEIGWVVFPWEVGGDEEAGPTENIVRLLEFIGENPDREGLKETPQRVIKSYGHLFGGYEQGLESIMKVFKDDTCDEMVILKDIEFYSTCEHHMLPFFGKAHIAYVPKGKVIGISKIARILEVWSRRLQIQERLTQQVTETLDKYLEPLGSACVMEAQHFCMTSRGVEKQNSVMITSSLTGVFKDGFNQARGEFLRLIGK